MPDYEAHQSEHELECVRKAIGQPGTEAMTGQVKRDQAVLLRLGQVSCQRFKAIRVVEVAVQAENGLGFVSLAEHLSTDLAPWYRNRNFFNAHLTH